MGNSARAILSFIGSAYVQGVGSMTGSFFLFAVAFVEHSKDQNVSPTIFFILGCALMCIGVVRVEVKRQTDDCKRQFTGNASLPDFRFNVNRLVYFKQGAVLLAHCTVVNHSDSIGGISRAALVDRRQFVPSVIRALSKTNPKLSIWYPEKKYITLSMNEEGTSRHEEIVKETVNNLLGPSTALLPKAKQEEGWLVFRGVSPIDGVIGLSTFAVSLFDTLGGEHGPVEVSAHLEERSVL